MEDGKIGIYIHIPFCVKKCIYCDFLSFAGSDLQFYDYIRALCSEIRLWGERLKYSGKAVDTVFVGGGTPSALPEGYITEIFSELWNCFNIEKNAEITLEANPGTVTQDKLYEYKSAGVNRLSIGIQSLDNNMLSFLGRIHTSNDAVYAFQRARRAGFENINVDLIFGMPFNDSDMFRNTLLDTVRLGPEHISAYSLIIEEKTPLYDRIYSGELAWPDDINDRNNYYFCIETLLKNGFKHYEISNFARPGRMCAHNIRYWRQEEYIGMGLGASSFINGARFSNGNNLRQYIENNGVLPYREYITLEKSELMNEFMMLGFRMLDGPDFALFKRKFDRRAEEVFKERLYGLESRGLITGTDGACGRGYGLTRKGLDFANIIFEEFI